MTESAHNPAYAHAAELKNIRFSYDRGNSWALDGVSLTVRAGERICLVGPNGSGKSTFARLIAGLAAPDGGDITLLGHRAYADALPNPSKPNLLLLGMPGLGKSYLGNAIGLRAIDRGIDALRLTAYRFVQDILADIRENRQNARRYQHVPLLILDDLGTEPDIPNVSTEWLFAVMNERFLAGRPSVCITNLSLQELQERYGERLMSRLCDKNTTQVMQLTGHNLRL